MPKGKPNSSVTLSSQLNHKFYFVLSFIDSYLFNIVNKQIDKVKFKRILFLAYCLVIIIIHLCVYLFLKNPNIFQIYNIRRCYTMNELEPQLKINIQQIQNKYGKEYFASAQKSDEELLMLGIYDILKNPARRKLYDKYLDHTSNYNIIQSPEFVFKKIIELGFVYIIFLLSGLSHSLDHKNKLSRKWIVIMVVIFLLIEVDMKINDTDQADIIDKILPQFTIAERSEMLKILLFPLMIMIRNYCNMFINNNEDIILQQLEQLSNQKKKIKKILEQQKTDENTQQIEEKIQQIQHLIDDIDDAKLEMVKAYGKGIKNKKLQKQILQDFLDKKNQQQQSLNSAVSQESKQSQQPLDEIKQRNISEQQKEKEKDKQENKETIKKVNEKEQKLEEELLNQIQQEEKNEEKKTSQISNIIWVMLIFLIFSEDTTKIFS